MSVCVPHPASKATCQSGLRDVLPKDHLQSWRMSIVEQSPDPVAENIEGFTRLRNGSGIPDSPPMRIDKRRSRVSIWREKKQP
jgi:hypothetical protein